MKHAKWVLWIVLPALLLTGCRQRLVREADDADFVKQETVLQTEPPTEPQTEPETESQTQLQTPPDVTANAGNTVTGGDANATGTQTNQPVGGETLLVELDANGGQCALSSLLVVAGKSYGSLPQATREGYAFDGWYTQQGVQAFADTVVTQAHTLQARWSARRTSTLYFDANGGRIKQTSKDLVEGTPYGALPTPLREGYDFLGWFTEPAGGTQVGESDIFEQEQTLYAQWLYNPFAYWSFVLLNTTQQIYSCQEVSVYIESETDHAAMPYCDLVSGIGATNIANSDAATDEWVLEKNPNWIIKCVSSADAAQYEALAARFPGKRILLVSSSAVYGTPSQQLYAKLQLAKRFYPDWYAELDLDIVSSELGASVSFYG
ncbi:MAG: InlB B-repeat-containing protein [Oscillospiraceae bacterium]|nr:InlB B-repeat-containing protein [Oscillospiraceae bacterium]